MKDFELGQSQQEASRFEISHAQASADLIATRQQVGDLRDGIGFYKWALQKGSKTDVNSQVEITDKFAKWPTLDPPRPAATSS